MTDDSGFGGTAGAAGAGGTGGGSGVAAGWYADPSGLPQQRWWNGERWTDDVSPNEPAAAGASAQPEPVQPAPAQPEPALPEPVLAEPAQPEPALAEPAPSAPAQPAPTPSYQYPGQQPAYSPTAATAGPPDGYLEGTNTLTPFIWVLLALPLVAIFSIFLIPVPEIDYYSSSSPFGPGYFAAMGVISLVSFVVYAATVVSAYFDWKALGALGLVKRMHWAWAFLSSGVYVIGRSVFVKKATRTGLLPLWIFIGVLAVTFIVLVAWTIGYTNAIMQSIPYDTEFSY